MDNRRYSEIGKIRLVNAAERSYYWEKTVSAAEEWPKYKTKILM